MKREVERLWNCKVVVLVAITIGTLVTVSKIFYPYLKKAGLNGSTQPLEKADLVLGQVQCYNSRRVRTPKTNWGDAVRPLGTVMQSFSCAQSDQKPEFTWHFWNSVVSNQGLFRPCLKTFVVPFLPTRRLSVRAWCADITMDITKQYHIFLQLANLLNNRFLS